MRNNLIKIVVGIALMYAGWLIAEFGDSHVSEETVGQKVRLCQNALTTAGFLGDSVREINMKVGKIKSKMYEYKYSYYVGAEEYVVNKTTNIENPRDSVTIWYDRSNPSLSSTINPCQELEDFKKDKRVGSGTWYIVIGALTILIGLGMSWGSFKEMIVTAVRGKKS
jgi:hypothetical protein